MSVEDYIRVGSLKSVQQFKEALQGLGIDLPCDDAPLAAPESPLAAPITVLGRTLGNRFAIHPMEGWDGTADGRPTELTVRRWQRFGASGAGLIWGGEAVAIRHDARANPNQLVLNADTQADIAGLRTALVRAHRAATDHDDDLLIGLQLTHSGRFCRPNDHKLEPAILYHHPILDRKFGITPDYPVLTDDDIRRIIDDYVTAAKRALDCGFDFVDIKHCHGYLGHEFLSAFTRPGPYGGSLENRTRYLRQIVDGIEAEAPGLAIGVRLSAFDVAPFKPDPDRTTASRLGPGVAESYCECMPYRYAFGCDQDQPTDIDLTETFALFQILRDLDIRFVNVTAGSPYYSPHIQRPALYPPSDGYQPPEDPLIGVARHLYITHQLKRRFPGFKLVGTAYTYLQDYLPHVAQAVVREGWVDFVGLGRMVLAYPELPLDLLMGEPLQTKRLCRTFSDCTTAPRNGLPSGCFPLDPLYKKGPYAQKLAQSKRCTDTNRKA